MFLNNIIEKLFKTNGIKSEIFNNSDSSTNIETNERLKRYREYMSAQSTRKTDQRGLMNSIK